MFEDDLLGIIKGYTVSGDKRDVKKECEPRNYTSKELMFIARKGDGKDSWKDEEARDIILEHAENQTIKETKIEDTLPKPQEEAVEEKVIQPVSEEQKEEARINKEKSDKEEELYNIATGNKEDGVEKREFTEDELKYIEKKEDDWFNGAFKGGVLLAYNNQIDDKETLVREGELALIAAGNEEDNIEPREFNEVELKFINDKGNDWVDEVLKNIVLTQVSKQNAEEVS